MRIKVKNGYHLTYILEMNNYVNKWPIVGARFLTVGVEDY